jgi:phosphoribosylamine--glycine ligase / phosphoribosylformylglycinamidine cyclo-ligase
MCLYYVQACAEHRLDSVKVNIRPGSAVSVILASQGYPGSYPKGKSIAIGETPEGEQYICPCILFMH